MPFIWENEYLRIQFVFIRINKLQLCRLLQVTWLTKKGYIYDKNTLKLVNFSSFLWQFTNFMISLMGPWQEALTGMFHITEINF